MTATARTIIAALAVAIVLIPAGPAEACTCMPSDIEQSADSAFYAFIGRQIARTETDDPNDHHVVLTIEVIESFKGNPGDTIQVLTGRGGGDCGVWLSESDVVGVFARAGAGLPRVNSCGSIWTADAVRYHYQPLPAPSGSGPAAFYAPAQAGDARSILLDASGDTLSYGMGPGDLLGAAVCPGSRRLVEAWRNLDHLHSAPAGGITVRSIPDLAVVTEHPLDYGLVVTRGQFEAQLSGLACHDAAGSSITYGVAEMRWEPLPGALVADRTVLVHIDGASQRSLDLGDARTHTVLPETDRVYAIVTETGQTLAQWQFSDFTELGSERLPDNDVGWHLVPTGDRITILTQDSLPFEDAWYWPEIDRLIPFSDEGTPLPGADLGRSGVVESIAVVDGTIEIALRTPNRQLDGAYMGLERVVVGADGELSSQRVVEGDRFVRQASLGRELLLFRDSGAEHPTMRTLSSQRDDVTVPLVTAGPMVALTAPPSAEPVPESTTTAAPAPSTTVAPPAEPTPPSNDATDHTSPTQPTHSAAAITDAGGFSRAMPSILLLIGTTAAVSVAWMLFIRRRSG